MHQHLLMLLLTRIHGGFASCTVACPCLSSYTESAGRCSTQQVFLCHKDLLQTCIVTTEVTLHRHLCLDNICLTSENAAKEVSGESGTMCPPACLHCKGAWTSACRLRHPCRGKTTSDAKAFRKSPAPFSSKVTVQLESFSSPTATKFCKD